MVLTLIHNPTAGDEGPEPGELVTMLERSGHAVRYCDSKKDIDAALAEEAELVLVAGGDGTVGKVLRRIGPGIPVAVMPLGSANNIACALGHDVPPSDLLAALRDPSPTRFDVAVAAGPWGACRFVEAIGLGPLACALAAGDDANVSGDDSIRYGRAAFRRFFEEAEPRRIHLTLDGRSAELDVVMLEILNINQIGPRLRFAPAADPGDGQLDVVCVPTERRGELLAWLDDPDAAESPFLAEKARAITVACDASGDVHVDDDFPEVPDRGLRFEVRLLEEEVTVLRAHPESTRGRRHLRRAAKK
jgi:diacylglycerol kinase (ATP)